MYSCSVVCVQLKLGSTLKTEAADVPTLGRAQLALATEALERRTSIAEDSEAGKSAVHLAPLMAAATPPSTLLQVSGRVHTINAL